MTSAGTRIGRPLALSMIAQSVRDRTRALAVLADELDVPVELGALQILAGPGSRGDPLAREAPRADNRSRGAPRPRNNRPGGRVRRRSANA